MSKLQLRYSNVGDVIIVDGYDNKVVLILKIHDKHIILQYDQKRDILKEVVRRCNCYDDLLAACEVLQKDVHKRYCDPHPMGQSEFCKIAEAAIDKTK